MSYYDLVHSHTYEDPVTGRLVDVLMPDDDAGYYRNAQVNDHRRPPHHGGSSPGVVPPRTRSVPPSAGHAMPVASRPVVVRSPGARPVVHAYPQQEPLGTINATTIAKLAPIVGQLCAAFLGRPNPPEIVGSDRIDRENAALHRDALAAHQQNQARILALSDLVGRGIEIVAKGGL
jgi:hypothetical protein